MNAKKIVPTATSDAANEPALMRLSISAHLALEQESLENGVEYVPTGFPSLDQRLGGGLVLPSLNVIGGGPKSLKSTVARIAAYHHAEAGGVVYYLDLENGRKRHLLRVLCRRANLSPEQARDAVRQGPSADNVNLARWRGAEEWVRSLGTRMFLEFTPITEKEFAARVSEVCGFPRAEGRRVMVVIDSLQKLLMENLNERRAGIDRWTRLLERLRHELGITIVVVSEVKRDQYGGGYAGGPASFKESGGIEYAADLAMTLTRSKDTATLRVELARDGVEELRGEPVAAFEPKFPYYDLEEVPITAERSTPGPKPTKKNAARAFLQEKLASGAVKKDDLCKEAKADQICGGSLLYEVAKEMQLLDAEVDGKPAWRLP